MPDEQKFEPLSDLPQCHENLHDRLYYAETIAAIREGVESAERGELKPAEQVFPEMKAKYNIQG